MSDSQLQPPKNVSPASAGGAAADALRILSAAEVREARRGDAGQWASLDELDDDGQVHAVITREFPDLADRWDGDPVGRRRFLEIMGASLALAGVAGTAGCARRAPEKIVPYVKPPAGRTPGDAQYFATSMPLPGASLGLLVKSVDGRPIKIEGNPEHPDSLGATDAFVQAALLGLYDPDRSQIVLGASAVSTWQSFYEALDAALKIEDGRGGAGLRIVTGAIDSPTLLGQLAAILARYPQAKWCPYEPAVAHLEPLGASFAYPEGPFNCNYRLAEANVIVALDADLLHDGPGAVRYSRDFAERRRAYRDRPLNRLYSIESTLSVTGAAADNRLALRPSRIPAFAAALASAVGVDLGTIGVSAAGKLDKRETRWVDALAADLLANRGKSAILAGREQQASVQTFAHLMNEQLGNVGATVRYVKAESQTIQSGLRVLESLAKDLRNGEVGLLLILGGNPAYNAPANLDFAKLIGKAKFSAHLSLYEDETSALCDWHLPAAHFLESWGDGRAVDGTLTTRQPLIAPLYEGKTEYELLSAVMRQPQRTNLDIVKQAWRERYQGNDFEDYWRKAIHDGLVADSAPQRGPESVVSKTAPLALGLADETKPPAHGAATTIELCLRLDPTIYDGRFANNGWLQELPKPLTKLTWDNAVLLSPTTAKELGVVNEQVVELEHGGRKVRGPVWILPGHADGCATVHLGYGRRAGGKVAKGAGFDAYPLWTSAEPAAPWTVLGVTIRPTADRVALACTQTHSRMEGRHLARSASLAEYQRDPAFAKQFSHGVTGGPQRGAHGHGEHAHAHDDHELGDHAHADESLFPSWKYTGHAWGMSIDLGSCTGCNACVVACQAENNIPVVGKQQVINGREMHWLRIDRYWEGPEAAPDSTHFQPVACMHCEQAPCELVCPVAATVHSAEGLNDMVYNRCVGTRYCSNNCPYKVRRFNFLQFADETTPSLKLLNNPEVTVRSRGVMEKCTYCVQRIDNARIKETVDGHPLADGALVTACQQACPAQAIVFGDLNDPNSEVSRRKALPLDYGLLTELNTRPRTSYLAQVHNPNPALAALEAPA
ncbi:MAG: TAT-variant-translocated molybdopterin oxidoreductase [Pirellulales bacterium]|nr:TAT-variant-translocated molybdopterin oxidoreductase [Pirellulales bacterium]